MDYTFRGTQGPWTIHDGVLSEYEGLVFYTPYRIETDWTRPGEGGVTITVADVRNPFYDNPALNPLTVEEATANSYLISGAPELLEALKGLIHLHTCEMEGLQSGQPTRIQWSTAYNAGVEAIRKALKH